MQSFHTFEQYLSSGYFLQKKKMMKNDIGYLQHLKSNLLKQRSLQEEDLGLAKQTLQANSTLNDDKVIAPFEYRNEKSKYISKSLVIPQSDAAIIGNESAQHEKQKEIFRQAVNNMKARLDEWKNKYLLIAPVAGKIAFASFVQENQQLPNNQTICYINPDNSNYFAEMIIPQNNFGKVKEGQKVLLKLPSYPYQEFGMVTGRIDFISSIPTDSGYLAKIILPDGLQTNYKKSVQYHEGLLAEGEIITADTKLSDRLFYQLKSLLHDR
jgi:exoribonuclease R